MLFTVSIKNQGGRRLYYRGHFTENSEAGAIAKVFRFLGVRPQDHKAATGDSRACACWALKWAAGATFEDARAAWEIVGARKRGDGTYTSMYIHKAADLLGLQAVQIRPANGERQIYRGTTLRAFARAHPVGRYVITVAGHALALIDGKYLDNARSSDLRKIVSAYQLLENKPRKLSQSPPACENV
jgi:hypothetical protein